PHAAEDVSKFNEDHTCLAKVVVATVRVPTAVGQAIQAVTSERDPHVSAAILCDRLQEESLISNFFWQVYSNYMPIHKSPEASIPSQPESPIGTTVGESQRIAC